MSPVPGWHVEDQVVEVLRPGDVGEELLQRLGQHEPSPHQCHLLVVDDQPGRDDVDALRHGRDDAPVVPGLQPSLGGAQHPGHREPPDVGVEQPDLEALVGDGRRQVDAERRLAHPALAAAHRDHPGQRAHAGRGSVLPRPLPGPFHQAGAFLLAHGGDVHRHVVDPGHRRNLAHHVTFDLVAHRAGGDGEGDGDGHPAAVDVDALDHAEVDDVGAELGVDDAPEDGLDRGGIRHAPIVRVDRNRPRGAAGIMAS